MARLLRLTVIAFLVAMLVIVAFGSGFGVGRFSPVTVKGVPPVLASTVPVDQPEQFGVFWEAYRVIFRDHVERKTLDPKKMAEGAIKGMIESLGDTHTVYLTAEEVQREKESSRGSYEGIGATVSQDDNKRLIITPIDGSPAQKAGLRAGDWIQAVEGADTTKMTLQDAVSKIRGPRGTKVRLTVLHEGESKPFDIEIARDAIPTVSVVSRLTAEGLAYIRIAVVSQRTAEELKTQITELRKQNPKGVIIDLRDNPGGILDVTIDVISQFAKEGVALVQIDGNGRKETHNIRPGGLMTDLPVAVLVNKNSASASEVISGALQDSGRAKVIGESTFGKGTVNILRELSDGGAVYVSVARWYTPKGRLIEGKGIAPDIELKLSEDDIKNRNDAQLMRAVEFLTTGK